jgi:hypothetical protein
MSDGMNCRIPHTFTPVTKCEQMNIRCMRALRRADWKRIARAAERGIISAYIIMSPTVYGQGTGPGNSMYFSPSISSSRLRDAGLSLQIPAYVRYAKRTGQAAYIGKGENIWGNVGQFKST